MGGGEGGDGIPKFGAKKWGLGGGNGAEKWQFEGSWENLGENEPKMGFGTTRFCPK